MRILPLICSNVSFISIDRKDTRINYFQGEQDSFVSKPSYDMFTGLKDKSTLLLDLGRRMSRKEDISLGMFDMDNFKSVNELLGYKTGDVFIKEISASINKIAQKYKVGAYRFGGDEFVILLTKTDTNRKLEILENIINSVHKNPIISSESQKYLSTAYTKLQIYEEDNKKLNHLIKLKTKLEVLRELEVDIPIKENLNNTEQELENYYFTLVQECLKTEDNPKIKKRLRHYQEIPKKELDEYLIAKLDKNAEAYQLKKWIRDFNANGFSMSGGILTFIPNNYIDKQPIDLINEAGEYLKINKSLSKGKSFFVESY